MNARSSIAEPDAHLLMQGQIALLGELADIGLEVAREIGRQAKAGPEPAALQHIAMAYTRVSRAVRLTLMLQARVAKDLDAAGDAEAEDAALLEPAYRHKFRVERVVERLIQAEHRDEDEVDRLAIEAGERLDDEDLYGDILDKPIGELVALICRDLGLHPDWTALAEQAWAKAEVESGAEGSPFNRLDAARAPPSAAAAEGGRDGEPYSIGSFTRSFGGGPIRAGPKNNAVPRV